MTNKTPASSDSHVLLLLFAVVAALLGGGTAALLTTTAGPAPLAPVAGIEVAGDDGDELGFDGFAGRIPDSKKPRVTAYFTRESYRQGDTAQLVVSDGGPAVTLQFFRAGGEDVATVPNDVMLGTPVEAPRSVRGTGTLSLRLGNWPSGVYFARLTDGPRVGYAPFVLAPRHLGSAPVAVVMPTMTWQAYNWRDDNRDGAGDTWYANWSWHTARLIRPFLNRGVPPHWKAYDAPFVRWLTRTNRAVDYLSDAELRTLGNGRELARAYRLVVFSGHHEYVTQHEYDVVRQYRDAGGNLMFLSANNFFWKVTLRNGVMTRVAQWRDLGRPEAALIGVQYRANDEGTHRAGWLVRDVDSARWLFAGTDIREGDRIGNGGIEIDHTTAASPKNTHVLAEIPDLFGRGYTAQMTYYETPAGAKVFAAGAFTLAGAVAEDRTIETLVANIWQRLAS